MPECSHMIYESLRKYADAYTAIVDDIADEVASTGSSEQDVLLLINTCFRAKTGGETSQQQLEAWCDLHGFRFSKLEKAGRSFLRFSRKDL